MCDLKEFLFSILRRWKIIVIVSFASVLVGSGYYYFNYKSNVDSNIKISKEDSIKDAPNNLSKEIWENLEKIYVGQLKFVGVGNEKVTSDVVRDAYLAELFGADFFMYMQERYFEDYSLKYVREIVVPSDGSLSNYLGVDVVYYDEEECKSILSGIIKYVQENSAEMGKHLGQHELFMVVDTVEEAGAEEYQEKIEAIQEVNSEEAVAERGQSFSVIKMIVYAILCCAFANACLWFSFILKDSLGDCIYNSRVLTEATNTEILGDFSSLRLKGKIDRIIYDILIAGKFLSETGIANLINYKLKQKYEHKCDYLLVGKVNKDILTKKANILMEANSAEAKFSVVALIDENLEEIQEIDEKQALIYVVRRFVDNKKEVIQNINIYKELGMEIAGIMFI